MTSKGPEDGAGQQVQETLEKLSSTSEGHTNLNDRKLVAKLRLEADRLFSGMFPQMYILAAQRGPKGKAMMEEATRKLEHELMETVAAAEAKALQRLDKENNLDREEGKPSRTEAIRSMRQELMENANTAKASFLQALVVADNIALEEGRQAPSEV